MRHRLLIGTGALVLGLTAAWAFAQNRAANESQAIRKATDAYVEAFNKGDVNGVLAIWTDDADYVDEAGKAIKGRKALLAMYQKSLQENKGLKVRIKTTAIRFLKDDIAMQDGDAFLAHASGETEISPFTAVWIRKDGRWLLAHLRELPGQAGGTADAPDGRLKDLDWLIGEWTHEDKDHKTTVIGRWMKGHKFLALDYTVNSHGDRGFVAHPDCWLGSLDHGPALLGVRFARRLWRGIVEPARPNVDGRGRRSDGGRQARHGYQPVDARGRQHLYFSVARPGHRRPAAARCENRLHACQALRNARDL